MDTWDIDARPSDYAAGFPSDWSPLDVNSGTRLDVV